jgi:uncharacterized protein (TIGR03083 family)
MAGSRWPGVRGALATETEAFAAALGSLDGEEFGRPTRLPAWTVRELAAHVWRGLDRVRTGLAQPPPAAVDTDAVSYWRSYDPADRGPEIALAASELATGFGDAPSTARALREVLREGLDAARREPDERPVATWGPTLRLDELLATRVLEVAIHGLDLADAVAREPWLSRAGAEITRGILVRSLGVEPPAIQTMDDVTFLELASGRRPPGRRTRVELGGLADRFPLLG